MDDYVSKPVNPTELIKAINRFLGSDEQPAERHAPAAMY